jgi:hypothetical protein
MNFLNDSFKTLKNKLEEKINFDEESDDTLQENENLKKICQHQIEEVTITKTHISKVRLHDVEI